VAVSDGVAVGVGSGVASDELFGRSGRIGLRKKGDGMRKGKAHGPPPLIFTGALLLIKTEGCRFTCSSTCVL
jgi:hypothetical protein